MGGIGGVLLAVLGGRCGRDGARMGLRSAFGSAPLRGLLGGVSDALRVRASHGRVLAAAIDFGAVRGSAEGGVAAPGGRVRAAGG